VVRRKRKESGVCALAAAAKESGRLTNDQLIIACQRTQEKGWLVQRTVPRVSYSVGLVTCHGSKQKNKEYGIRTRKAARQVL
jgi:hypothetical protein